MSMPALKGFYDMHAQLPSVSYIHAKRRVLYVYIRKHCLAYFSYTETLTRMRVLQEDEIWFTSSLNDRSKLKRQYTAVKSRSGISVGPNLNPYSLCQNKILVTLSLKIFFPLVIAA